MYNEKFQKLNIYVYKNNIWSMIEYMCVCVCMKYSVYLYVVYGWEL